MKSEAKAEPVQTLREYSETTVEPGILLFGVAFTGAVVVLRLALALPFLTARLQWTPWSILLVVAIGIVMFRFRKPIKVAWLLGVRSCRYYWKTAQLLAKRFPVYLLNIVFLAVLITLEHLDEHGFFPEVPHMGSLSHLHSVLVIFEVALAAVMFSGFGLKRLARSDRADYLARQSND